MSKDYRNSKLTEYQNMDIKKRQNGEVDVELSKKGFHIHFTNTPKWAYILIAIGVMFALIIWAHSLYRAGERAERIKDIAVKYIKGKPLNEKDVGLLESLTPEEEDKLFNTIKRKSKLKLKTDEWELEQDVAPGTALTIERDGDKVSVEKGAPYE